MVFFSILKFEQCYGGNAPIKSAITHPNSANGVATAVISKTHMDIL